MKKQELVDTSEGLFGKRKAYPKNLASLAPTLVLASVVLLATWMGYEYGGYFVKDWTPAAAVLAVLALIAAVAGLFGRLGSRQASVALGLFAVYATWTFASLFWSPNRGDAWVGAGQTLLYLLCFGVVAYLVALGGVPTLDARRLGPRSGSRGRIYPAEPRSACRRAI